FSWANTASPEEASGAVTAAEAVLAGLSGYDVSDAEDMLDDAKTELADGEYDEAVALAEEAGEFAPAIAAIEDAEDEIADLEDQFYDVTAALAKLDDAKDALADGDYEYATQLANAAPALAEEPQEKTLEEAQDAIDDAEAEIANLEGQMYDVAAAKAKIAQAKAELADEDYVEAYNLAGEAAALAVAPYWLYALIVAIVLIVILVGFYLYRQRQKK
ncbi:unnamed protein product, partial [marine sediment metagenome]